MIKSTSAILVFGFVLFNFSLQAQSEIPKGVNELFIKYTCFTCHKSGGKLIGPSWEDIAAKRTKKADIMANILKPNPANWPTYPPMAPMPQVSQKDLEKMADWIVKIQPKGSK